MRKLLFTLLLLLSASVYTIKPQTVQRPKLVVGIIVDQMRYEYLYRFYPYFGERGFKRLMSEGSNFTYAHYNYVPTQTAPGHASVSTGSTPFFHGIISNAWYDRTTKKGRTSVEDDSASTVGGNNDEGKKSPRMLLATTMTDQLKLASIGPSKVISVSIKDRAAILPGGHLADGAFWYDETNGNFITSSYYMKTLPDWVDKFNRKKLADKLLSKDWVLAKPEEAYKNNGADNSPFEHDVFKEGKTNFPHSFAKLKGEDFYGALPNTPYGNEMVKELACEAITNERLGKDDVTDFLAISFSSPDYVGHAYGIYSYEIQDIYIRLDEQIADLLKTLDEKVGKGNYLLFLTADHAAEETPGFLKSVNMPVGALNQARALDSLKGFCKNAFNANEVIEDFSNNQIFLNRKVIQNNSLNYHTVLQKLTDYLYNTFPQIQNIQTRDDLLGQTATREPKDFVLNGFNSVRSGDIAITLLPGYLPSNMSKGTTHGTSYAYDTHVPMLFYGWHVPAQENNSPVYIVDIAATICNLLHITEPSCCIGVPLIR